MAGPVPASLLSGARKGLVRRRRRPSRKNCDALLTRFPRQRSARRSAFRRVGGRRDASSFHEIDLLILAQIDRRFLGRGQIVEDAVKIEQARLVVRDINRRPSCPRRAPRESSRCRLPGDGASSSVRPTDRELVTTTATEGSLVPLGLAAFRLGLGFCRPSLAVSAASGAAGAVCASAAPAAIAPTNIAANAEPFAQLSFMPLLPGAPSGTPRLYLGAKRAEGKRPLRRLKPPGRPGLPPWTASAARPRSSPRRDSARRNPRARSRDCACAR